MKKLFAAAWQYALDTIAPPDPEIRRIEGMSVEEFTAEALSFRDNKHEEYGKVRRVPDGVTAFLPYHSPIVKKALVELKDRRNMKIATLLGSILDRFLTEVLTETKADLLVPISISNKKRRERGWNQCELMTAQLQTIPVCTDTLTKIRETGDQVGHSRTERLERLRGSFAIRLPDAVRDKTIIVFDDIVTTGATLHETKSLLLDAGATQVILLALAY